MAGSIKWFLYTTDSGTQFAVEADESNTEAINDKTGDYIDSSNVQFGLPRNVTPRYAYYASADKTRTIRCLALTTAIYNGLSNKKKEITDPIDGKAKLKLVRIRPEKIRLPFANDTGLDDGDAT